MHSTKGQIVDRDITSTDKLKAPAEHFQVPTIYWLPKIHKKPFKIRFISASSKCTNTKPFVLLTSAISKLKERIMNYCNKAYDLWIISYFLCVFDFQFGYR